MKAGRGFRWLAGVATLLGGAAQADYQAGLDAYRAGDFATAMTQWKAEVSQPGEPENLATYREALYAIGMLYWRGEGVAQDYAVSAVWLKQAADINHPDAQNKLGYLYGTGQGVPRNFEQARHWLEMAAAQGNGDAAHNLDVLLREQIDASAKAVAEPATDAEWIRAQDPQYYTLQVIALRKPDNLRAFIGRHPDWAPFAIYRPAGNAQPLWVLLQGAYLEPAAARAAAAAFPEGIQQRDQLWIRRFDAVQRELE